MPIEFSLLNNLEATCYCKCLQLYGASIVYESILNKTTAKLLILHELTNGLCVKVKMMVFF